MVKHYNWIDVKRSQRAGASIYHPQVADSFFKDFTDKFQTFRASSSTKVSATVPAEILVAESMKVITLLN